MSQQVTDSLTDPEGAERAVSALLAPDETVAVPPPDTSVTLCGGYLDPIGVLHRTAEVRELNGEDEEALARGKSAQSWIYTQNAILERAVVKVGTLEPDATMLQSMFIGDRAELMLAIRMATYGPDYEVKLQCPKCFKEFEVVIELDKDIKRREMEDPLVRTFEVPLRRSTAKVRLVTGADQLFSWSADSTPAEQNTKLLQKILVALDDKPVHFPEQVAKKMGVKDRQTIIQFVVEHAPGPLMGEVSVPCSHCEESSPLPLSMAELFQG